MLRPHGAVRPALLAGTFTALVVLLLPTVSPVTAADQAPAPRAADAAPAERVTAVELDHMIIDEVKEHSEIMKNLEYLSDVIGPRLTGSKQLEKANNWTAEKMKEYGLKNVRLEAWEIPVGWERGPARMTLIEPHKKTELSIASRGWSPGTKGKITGKVVIVNARTKAELDKYRGKLKNAIVLRSPPRPPAPVHVDNTRGRPAPKNEAKEPKKDTEENKAEPKKKKIIDAGFMSDDLQPRGGLRGITEFLKEEGVACYCTDAGRPLGLLVTSGRWPADRAEGEADLTSVAMAHEHYAMLYRLASREGADLKVEVEIENKFIPGPITVYNTIGEVVGSEKPDEFVVVGAHLDSWDLGRGTTDNGTGSSIVLETARTVSEMAKKGHGPKRTIRFALFSGEEQGLVGSRKYVERHKDELDKHSVALVHDTGTGIVKGWGLLQRKDCQKVLEPELVTLKELDGWEGLSLGGTRGGTDHYSYVVAGVPGFAVVQDMNDYILGWHTQADTFDKAIEPNLVQGAQVMTITAMRIANLPELLPRLPKEKPKGKKDRTESKND